MCPVDVGSGTVQIRKAHRQLYDILGSTYRRPVRAVIVRSDIPPALITASNRRLIEFPAIPMLGIVDRPLKHAAHLPPDKIDIVQVSCINFTAEVRANTKYDLSYVLVIALLLHYPGSDTYMHVTVDSIPVHDS